MSEDGDQAKLAYGRSASEEVKLALACRKGSGKLSVTRFVAADQAGTPPILTLGSGSARGRWLAETKPAADQAGAVALTVDMPTTEPMIDAFVRNGWVDAILADGKLEGMAPQPGDTAVAPVLRLLRLIPRRVRRQRRNEKRRPERSGRRFRFWCTMALERSSGRLAVQSIGAARNAGSRSSRSEKAASAGKRAESASSGVR